MFKAKKTDDDAVSPVIGVILLVAVTVALVALATVIVFDIGSDVSDTADATVQLEQSGDDVVATVVRNENVDSFLLADDEDGESDSFDSVGDTETLDISDNGEAGDTGTVSVIATLEDGSDEVLTSTDYVVPEA